jgi:hypothetical protein
MKNWGGHFTPELGGHFELESGGHFKLELGGQYHWNMQFISPTITFMRAVSCSCGSCFKLIPTKFTNTNYYYIATHRLFCSYLPLLVS